MSYKLSHKLLPLLLCGVSVLALLLLLLHRCCFVERDTTVVEMLTMLRRSTQLFLGVSIGAAALASAATSVFNLSQADWTVGSSSLNISVPAQWPSQVHVDLYNEHVIGDPYYGLNDFNLRWVANSNWTYSSNLSLYVKAIEKSSGKGADEL